MEKDDEVKGAGNSYDFGARMYDSRLGKWMSVDPLQKEYPHLSSYAYVANSPIQFIDPDGERIEIAGNKDYAKNTLMDLQKLTNSKLKLKKEGDVFVVIIKKEKAVHKNKKLDYGTALVKRLVEAKNNLTGDDITTTITDNEGIKKNISSSLVKKFMDAEKGGLTVSNGGSPLIRYDFDEGKDVVNEDGTKGRPKEIGLAHELIHADRIISNTTIERDDDPDFYERIDPDSGEKGVLYLEEVEVRKLENNIRKEQNYKLRATPEIDDDYEFEEK